MIVYQVGCFSKNLQELVANMRGLKKTWVPPFWHYGTMQDRVWEVEHTGRANGGGNRFTRGAEARVNTAGRSVVRDGITWVVWEISGMEAAFGQDRIQALARYVGYAYHVRERIYLLPASAVLWV